MLCNESGSLFQGGVPMPEPKFSRNHDLECLRLAAECRQLAQDVANSALQSHFLRMAEAWTTLAQQEPGSDTRH